MIHSQSSSGENYQSPISAGVSSSESEGSAEPRRLRSLQEIYDATEIIELEDEVMLLMGVDEPINYKQATTNQNRKLAMKQEMDAIERNNTWELSELPPGHKAIGLKWIFKLKRDTNGKIIKHKARIVAKGYVQKWGVDCEEVFAPVTRLETIRLLLALAVKNGWEVHHLDVKTAFLNGDI